MTLKKSTVDITEIKTDSNESQITLIEETKSDAVSWLQRQKPGHVNREIIARAAKTGTKIYKTDGGVFSAIATSKDGLHDAIKVYEYAMLPMEGQRISAMLAAMDVTQAHKTPSSPQEAKARLMLYIEAMKKWPADCVSEALQKARKWFPTIKELEDDIAKLMGPRAKIYAAIKNGDIQSEKHQRDTSRKRFLEVKLYQLAKDYGLPAKLSKTLKLSSPDHADRCATSAANILTEMTLLYGEYEILCEDMGADLDVLSTAKVVRIIEEAEEK